jgi:protein gp37
MGTKTGIEWTDATWNPILGCSRVSEGCRNCYAERIAGRFPNSSVYGGLTQIVNGRAVWSGQIKETKKLLEPLSWKSPKRVFVNSMSDLFHENVSDEQRDRIFAVMALCPPHTFQVLTKRPERMLQYLSGGPWGQIEERAVDLAIDYSRISRDDAAFRVRLNLNWIPLTNVWLGVSVENRKAADERIPLLLQTPAAKRFISAEPLLGPIEFSDVTHRSDCIRELGKPAMRGIDWVICGGESGPGARPMHPDWARSLRDQCQAAGVPFFFKQWGEWLPAGCDGAVRQGHAEELNCSDEPVRVGKKAAGALLEGREWKEFPTCQ